MPQSRLSKVECTQKEIDFYAIPGQVSEDVGFPNDSVKATFNFTKTQYQQNMNSLGINQFCAFNSPESVNITDDDLNTANYDKFIEKIADLKAINRTGRESQRESFGVGIFKMFTLITSLEESDYLFLLMPTKLYSSDGT